MNLNKWIANNTFHHGQFWDLKHMIEEKEKKGLTLSLCLPTLNEEKTIGKEVILFKSELMDRYQLLDEIAVIDSGSTDQRVTVHQLGFKEDDLLADGFFLVEGRQ
ncbi:MAG TPA: hypothetical protein VJ904_13700, partial [Tichowtungia sp.]|nr:hypothetical protein [Tichowtungia sp.]